MVFPAAFFRAPILSVRGKRAARATCHLRVTQKNTIGCRARAATRRILRRMTHRRVSGDNGISRCQACLRDNRQGYPRMGMGKGSDRKCHLINDACVSPINGSLSRETEASLSFLRACSIREASCYLVFAA